MAETPKTSERTKGGLIGAGVVVVVAAVAWAGVTVLPDYEPTDAWCVKLSELALEHWPAMKEARVETWRRHLNEVTGLDIEFGEYPDKACRDWWFELRHMKSDGVL